MKIKDILHNTDFESVARHMELHYGSRYIEDYRHLYDKLKNFGSNSVSEDFSIIIQAFRENDNGDSEYTETFDENDTSLYFDVSGITSNDDCLYSIIGIDKSEFPEYNISPKTLKLFSYSAILAHCLHEITFLSFD